MFWTSAAKKTFFFLRMRGGGNVFFLPGLVQFPPHAGKIWCFFAASVDYTQNPEKKVKLVKYPLWDFLRLKSNGLVQKTTKEISQIFRFSPQSPWNERVRFQMHGRVQKIILSFVQNVTSPSAIWRTHHTMDELVTKWTEESNAKMHDCVEKCTTELKSARTRPKNNPFLRAKCNESV